MLARPSSGFAFIPRPGGAPSSAPGHGRYDQLVAVARARGRSVPARSMPSRLAATVSMLGSVESVRSYRSRASVLSNRSVGSVASSWSFLSAGSLLSVGSVGSILSIGSAGSILSIGSSGSILSIGASGGFLSFGSASDAGHENAKAGGDQIPTRPRLIS